MNEATKVRDWGAGGLPPRVLVIDGNEEHQVLSVTSLSPRGYQVRAVSTARDGLRLLQEGPFDAIIIDAKLRDISALEFLQGIVERFPNTPRILLVPHGGDELALRGLDAGASAFVMKSPSFRILLPAVVDRLIREVRSHRQMEDALRESQRVLSTLMSNLPGMAYRCRNDPPVWTTEFVSDGAEALTGFTPEDFTRGAITSGKLIHPDDLAAVMRTIDDAVAAKRPFQILYRLRTASGAEKWVWEQGRGVYEADGKVRSLEGFISDVTEKEVGREHLERSERMFRAVFEDAADGIMRIDETGRLVAINTAGAEFLHRPLSEIVGQSLSEFIPPEEVPRAMNYIQLLLNGGPTPEAFETAIVSPNHGRRTIEFRGRRVLSSSGPHAVEVIARDITERRELLRKIAESDRLASLGRLSLYVAHEINTPLTSISLLTAAIERCEKDPALRAKLEKIHAERRRAATIISGLLNFSRPQQVEGRDTDLRVLVQAAVEHVEPHRRAGVSLFAALGDRPVVSRVDPTQMESVVVSLLKNALEATSHGSVVVHVEERIDNVVLHVTDTGEGMSTQVLERIFEPFFTTKKFGHGTGMGLAWSKKVVDGHGGAIEVISKLGQGSTFTVRLPKSGLVNASLTA